MSLVLPGNARELRFMVADDSEEELPPPLVALGRPRVRRERDVKASWNLFSPWPKGDWSASARERRRARIQQPRPKQSEPITGKPEQPTLRQRLAELAGQWPTALPIPGFRAAPPTIDPTAALTVAPTERRAPLAVWIVASVLMALVSYEAVSHVLARIETSVTATHG